MDATSQKPASLFRRLAAIVYDLFLLFSVLFLASIPIVAGFRITYGDPYYGFYQAYLFIVAFLYYGWFWVHGGRTLGMKSWGVRVVSTRSSSVTWLQAMLRFSLAIVSWLFFGMGFLWSLIRKDRATWHDLASDTRLIHDA